MLLASSIALSGASLAAPDQAQSATGMASEHRLSPAEIETVLDDAARRRELAEPSEERLPPPIQGEIGFSVGTGGYRSAYGTAVVPLPGKPGEYSLGPANWSPSGTHFIYRLRKNTTLMR